MRRSFGDALLQRLPRVVGRVINGKYYYNEYLFPRVTRDEVYLVSFPRSGNTWLRCMLASLVHDRELTPELVETTVPDVHKSRRRGTLQPPTRPLAIKSHSPYIKIPSKVIYVVRDGRDALISYYHYLIRRSRAESERVSLSMSPGAFFSCDKLWPSPWHLHIMGWMDGLSLWQEDHYRIVRYEDLLQSPTTQLASIAQFIGLSADERSVQRAIARTTRSRLAELEADAGLGTLGYISLDTPRWQNCLSNVDLAQFEALAGAALLRLGYPLHSDKKPPPKCEPETL
jgi:hypothetical protein